MREIYRKWVDKIRKPLQSEIDEMKITLKEQEIIISKLSDNIKKNNERLNALECCTDEERLAKLENNIRKNNERLNALERCTNEERLAKLEDNIRKNNLRLNAIEKNDSATELTLVRLQTGIKNLDKKVNNVTLGEGVISNAIAKTENNVNVLLTTVTDESQVSYSKIDYFDFENHFRGSKQNIKERQKMYLPVFEKCDTVLDVGCGRGEFLELLRENGIKAKGVDLYLEYAEYCSMNGLDVECGDGVEYLANCEKFDGIMVAQVVEHLDVDQIVTLCERAYDRLNDKGVFVMETPNPKALSIYVNEFYMDPSHIKPVHPETLKYLVEKAGFKNCRIEYTESSRVNKEIPELKSTDISNADEFNKSMKEVSELLYGSRDYALIAEK